MSLFIRWDEPRYTRLENSRLRTRRYYLSRQFPDDDIKIKKGILYHNNTRCDKFDLMNNTFNNFNKTMAVRWWNINGRWNVVDKNFMKDLDILFLLETHCNSSSMPSISGFNVIGDPTFPLVSSHGGTVVYIKNEFFEHIQQIRYGRCTVSFNFTFAPKVVFIGVYIYPYASLNFRDSDFATILCEMDY